jgi:hypothetical protein
MDEVSVNTNYACYLCNVENMTHEEWKEHHFSDKVHLNKALELSKKKMYCEKCDLQCSSNLTYSRHLTTKKHTGKGFLQPEDLYCGTCKMQCRSRFDYENHLQTKLHAKRVQGGNNYRCESCDYSCKLTHLWEQHCNTKKHLASVTTSS